MRVGNPPVPPVAVAVAATSRHHQTWQAFDFPDLPAPSCAPFISSASKIGTSNAGARGRVLVLSACWLLVHYKFKITLEVHSQRPLIATKPPSYDKTPI